MEIHCLKTVIESGGTRFPIFVGFAPAQDILKVASAPSFQAATPHSDISTTILTPPVKDWQRPLSQERVNTISKVYDNMGGLMPNPVLLCENVIVNGSGIDIRQQTNSGIPTTIWIVTVPIPTANQQSPLWILDGQHRINGLSKSAQAANPLPVVLLLNQGESAYQGPLVAKLFAQVTTEATALDELHNEWLTFAFDLDSYAIDRPDFSQAKQAMKTVAELCRNPQIPNTAIANPFHNKIRFNYFDETPCGPLPGGFNYNCIELKNLIVKEYYSCVATIGHLSTTELAAQIALAFIALTTKVTNPRETVFFGTTKYEQRIMQDAFLAGVMSYLLAKGPCADWAALLDTLQFPVTDWNFSLWTVTLNGIAGSNSRKLAIQVFKSAFSNGRLPSTVTGGNIADYLQGNEAEIELTCYPLTPKGKRTKKGAVAIILRAGNTLSRSISPAKIFAITKKSLNIAKLEIIDKQHPPGKPVWYKEKGELLSTKHSNPLQLIFRFHHYGGIRKDCYLTLQW
jgi:hypothetical protein